MRRNRLRGTVVAAAFAATAVLVAGCGGGENQAAAVSDLCSSLESYSAALTQIQGLSPESTLADVQTATTNAQKAHAQVVVDAEKVQAANMATINSAQRDLEVAAKSLPETTTVEQAKTELQPEIQALSQAYSEVYNSLECSSEA
jgi:hypothetical protein